MVWGRNQTPEQIESLAATWNVSLFLLGHEKAETGAMPLSDRAVVLNSDHDRGVYAELDTRDAVTAEAVMASAKPLAG